MAFIIKSAFKFFLIFNYYIFYFNLAMENFQIENIKIGIRNSSIKRKIVIAPYLPFKTAQAKYMCFILDGCSDLSNFFVLFYSQIHYYLS